MKIYIYWHSYSNMPIISFRTCFWIKILIFCWMLLIFIANSCLFKYTVVCKHTEVVPVSYYFSYNYYQVREVIFTGFLG